MAATLSRQLAASIVGALSLIDKTLVVSIECAGAG
jgi:hypothetical protein